MWSGSILNPTMVDLVVIYCEFWNIKASAGHDCVQITHSNRLDLVIVVAAGFCEVQQNRTNFGLHVGLWDEALLQQHQ